MHDSYRAKDVIIAFLSVDYNKIIRKSGEHEIAMDPAMNFSLDAATCVTSKSS